MKRDLYMEYRVYQTQPAFGFHTVFVEPSALKRPRWSIRFMGSPVWRTGFKTKFDALVWASHALGYAPIKCGWEPA